MKTKVAFGMQVKRVASFVSAAAIVGVLGLGGLALNSNDVSARSSTSSGTSSGTSSSSSKTGTSGSTSSSSKTSGTSSTTSGSSTAIPSTSAGTTATTATPTQSSSTPNTGIFTGDSEFTQADGLAIVTVALAAILLSYVAVHNRKNLFRRRVGFRK